MVLMFKSLYMIFRKRCFTLFSDPADKPSLTDSSVHLPQVSPSVSIGRETDGNALTTQ